MTDMSVTCYDRLIGDHQRIAELIAELLGVTRLEPSASEKAISLLFQLSIQLSTHLAYEDEVADLTQVARLAGKSPSNIGDILEELNALRADWHRYIAHWSPENIVAHWADFARDTNGMLQRIAVQLALENELLYTPALRHGVVSLRNEPMQ